MHRQFLSHVFLILHSVLGYKSSTMVKKNPGFLCKPLFWETWLNAIKKQHTHMSAYKALNDENDSWKRENRRRQQRQRQRQRRRRRRRRRRSSSFKMGDNEAIRARARWWEDTRASLTKSGFTPRRSRIWLLSHPLLFHARRILIQIRKRHSMRGPGADACRRAKMPAQSFTVCLPSS